MQVLIQEESLGEGLLEESRLFGLAEKMEVVRLLAQAGVRRLQLGGFVPSRSAPQLANTDVLVSLVQRQYPDICCTALVYNERGLERAVAAGIPMIEVMVPLTDSDSRRLSGRLAAELLDATTLLIAMAREEGGVKVQAHVRCVFGCYDEGPVAESTVLATLDQLVAAGATGISLADSAGLAYPHQVKHLATAVAAAHGGVELALHLHDTRGLGLVNLYAGYEAGIRVFELAAGGLGGCPFVAGALGNIATEDAVHLLEGMGVSTGIDLPLFCQAVAYYERLLERQLPGRMGRVVNGQAVV